MGKICQVSDWLPLSLLHYRRLCHLACVNSTSSEQHLTFPVRPVSRLSEDYSLIEDFTCSQSTRASRNGMRTKRSPLPPRSCTVAILMISSCIQVSMPRAIRMMVLSLTRRGMNMISYESIR